MKYGTEDHRALGSYLIVELTGGSSYSVVATFEDSITNAMRRWIDTDKDELMTLRLTSGGHVHVAVSDIRYVTLSTPDGRDKSHDENLRLQAIEADDDKEGWQVGRSA